MQHAVVTDPAEVAARAEEASRVSLGVERLDEDQERVVAEEREDARRLLRARAVQDGLPVMGICLGHQLLGLASGLQTYKMRYGHRGANQPVVDLQERTVSITSQNHGFAVAHPSDGMLAAHPTGATSPPVTNQHGSEVEVRYVNANDGTVEGLDVIGKPCFTVQFHPEACPGPHDAAPLFLRFRSMVDNHIGGEH